MPSSKEYLNYILDQLSPLSEISYRPMMGEYIIYYNGKIAFEICDNRLLVKPVPAALKMLPNAPLEPPYAGAKDMILVENVDDGEFLRSLVEEIYFELPAPKPRKTK
ncbi:MAG: TfoX/Sxy family protein [Oscillospiraceae bacterium]